MSDEDIIRMAREVADQSPREDWGTNTWVFGEDALKRFAALVAGAIEQAKPWVKTYSGGSPHYTTPEEKHMIKTWQERCEEHPAHDGIVTTRMIQKRMQEEIDELRAALEDAKKPRQWQWLTEAEKVNVALECGCADVAWMDFADAIEKKLKEKNLWK